jgi:radical SAM protein with 4Fe4S-binding SPASM domain
MTHTSTGEIQDFHLWEKLIGKRTPFSFDLEVTARCNNDCRHCYINLPAGDLEARGRELSLGEITDIASQAVKMGTVWCLLTGGEPLLRPDFAQIYMALKRLGLLVSVFTNATAIQDEHIQLWKKYPPRDIEVTVYGVTQETYERVTRRAGSYENFRRGLDRLFAAGIRVRLKAMAIRSNLDEQPEIARFCRQHTKDYFRFDPQLHLRYDGNAARNEEIRQERLSSAQIVALEQSDEQRMQSIADHCSDLINQDLTHNGCNHLFHCGAGKGSFSVSYDGQFRLCSALWAPGTTADLRRVTLAEAWNNLVPQVRDMRSSRQEYQDTCRKCALANLCLWCPAHAYLEMGELDGETPYFCAVAHARAAVIQQNLPG